MSLIHEALKKAEQQRRLGDPPNLGTPFARAPQRRSLLPYLAVAIVGVLGAGWYLSRPGAPDASMATRPADGEARRAEAMTSAGRPPQEAKSAPASNADQRRPNMGPDAVPNPQVVSTLAPARRPDNQAMPPANPPTMQEVAERESEPHPPGANPLAPGEAAPLVLGVPPPETPANDAEGLAAKQATKERQLAAGTAPPSPAGDAGRSPFFKERATLPPPAKPAVVASDPAAPAPPRSSGFVPPDQKSAPPNAAAAAAPASPSPATLPASPALEQLPVYWQLPYNVRKELPELKMSMHVYSATPAQRFVVLNGNRQVEGDELGGDVHVSEIRSDGVVLTYHGQRFIVPRGGS
ncbi:MAG: hypothetical protein AMXMBFR59_01640 [Rhodanobacteraceae bacterium]